VSASGETPAWINVPLWRAIAVYRLASLVYAVVTTLVSLSEYRHPLGALLMLGVMACWTAVTAYAYPPTPRRRLPLLVIDLTVTGGCLISTMWVESASRLANGAPPLTLTWVAGPVLAWAVSGGRRMGVTAALLLSLADLFVHSALPPHSLSKTTTDTAVLMLLTGLAVGHVSRLAVEAQTAITRGAQLEAAARERERLARGIHDSVLQVLALVQRQGAAAGGELARLGRLAGEQEAALRALINSGQDPWNAGADPAAESTDLRLLLSQLAAPAVSVAAPATAVRLAPHAARELAAAVGAALDNVHRHAGDGARAWVLVEDEDEAVTVTIRDDGPGIAPGRLAAAATAGRLGVAQSIRGRVRDLGGTVHISSAPGEGTEVELRVPRPHAGRAVR
jgi:signal transduction histidine kinase